MIAVMTVIFAVVAASAGAGLGASSTRLPSSGPRSSRSRPGRFSTATSFELFEPARKSAGLLTASVALCVGAAVFIAVDAFLESRLSGQGAVGLALVAAVTLDGVPENLALGVTLEESGSYALLAAIVSSNFPEAFGGAASMRRDGQTPAASRCASGRPSQLSSPSSLVVGRLVAGSASTDLLAALLAFAAGAVLASVADTVMPEAYREGGPFVAFATAAGFLVAYSLAT